MSNQVVEPNNVANTYSTPVNSTANSKSDGGPWINNKCWILVLLYT